MPGHLSAIFFGNVHLPQSLCVDLQTFEAALFLEEEEEIVRPFKGYQCTVVRGNVSSISILLLFQLLSFLGV